jgi:hypothetical protein
MTVLLWALTIILGLLTAFALWIGHTTHAWAPWDVRLDVASALDEAKGKGPPVTLCLMGNLPKKMYVKSSHTLTLQGSTTIQQPDVGFDLPRSVDVQIELLCASFEVDGERQQRKHIPQIGSNVSFRWSVMPKESGMQELTLIASWIDKDGRNYEIGAKIHKVKVFEFLGLPAQKLRFFSTLGVILTLLLAIASTLISWLSWLYP